MICAPPSLAISGFARAHFLFHFDDLHPFVSAAVGGGSIRHVATFNSIPKCGSDMKTTCVDTIDAGPIFLGGGGGLIYNLSDAFALTAETNLLARLHQLHVQRRHQRRRRRRVLGAQPAFASSVAKRWAWA